MVAKTAAEQWRALDQAAKSPYEEKAAKEKEEFNKALASFKAGGGEVIRKGGKRKGDDKKRAQKDKRLRVHIDDALCAALPLWRFSGVVAKPSNHVD